MPQSVCYYPELRLVVVRIWGAISMASLSARMAEWMYELDVPAGFNCLTDARELLAVDRATEGTQELVTMQARVYEDVAAPGKSAILVESPVGHVVGRLFEQQSDGVLEEQVKLFRSEAEAFGFLDLRISRLSDLPNGPDGVLCLS